MSGKLIGYHLREFVMWMRSEYPDLAEEFDALPRTLIDFAATRYPYLFEEYNEQAFVQIYIKSNNE